MRGTVVAIHVAAHDAVVTGTPLVVVEAMKMEHTIRAPGPGLVHRVHVGERDVVGLDQVVVSLVPGAAVDAAVAESATIDADALPPSLQAVLELRSAATEVRAPKRGRAARLNIDDLCDAGTFVEYGALALPAQRNSRPIEELRTKGPADGLIAGIGDVDGARTVVLSYDSTVMAGTQGYIGHYKTDRMIAVAAAQRLPVVFCTEGGGGRPNDTATTAISALDTATFRAFAQLSGTVPSIGIAAGRCFAGNAAILGCCDVVIATRDANIGMAGPAMISGGGLGDFAPDEIGPSHVQAANGVIDILVDDEAAAIRVARQYLSYFSGSSVEPAAGDQRLLRHVVPENRRTPYAVRDVISLVADTDSVLELRAGFGAGVVTALARVEGRPLGLIANSPEHLGGALDRDGADKLARFLQLCDAYALPVVSLCDTPGFMVGPASEETATVRHFSRIFVVAANLRVPVVCVILRKAYGLGAQAMMAGHSRAPVATVAWPTAEIGAMGIEGAVQLGQRRTLEAIADPAERQRMYDQMIEFAYEMSKATNVATAFEIDDVIDPADTRRWITQTVGRWTGAPGTARFIDTW